MIMVDIRMVEVVEKPLLEHLLLSLAHSFALEVETLPYGLPNASRNLRSSSL